MFLVVPRLWIHHGKTFCFNVFNLTLDTWHIVRSRICSTWVLQYTWGKKYCNFQTIICYFSEVYTKQCNMCLGCCLAGCLCQKNQLNPSSHFDRTQTCDRQTARHRTANTVLVVFWHLYFTKYYRYICRAVLCCGISNDDFIANLLVSLPLKGVWKPFDIWQSYGQGLVTVSCFYRTTLC